MNDEIAELAAKHRRELHQIPEPSLGEHDTAEYIERVLASLGVSHKRIAGTGIVAVIRGSVPSAPTIAFRADMDALPIRETTNLPYSSLRPGFMHACGHDLHMSLLLGLAEEYSRRTPPCSLLLIFQPGEEGSGGAELMLKDGLFDAFGKPDLVFGCHIDPALTAGKVTCRPGPAWAGSCEFVFTLNGKGGHGAQPQNAADLVYVFSAWYTAMQGFLSRRISPFETAVLTCGRLEGATVPNVFTDKLVIGGTFRFFTRELFDRLMDGMKKQFASLSQLYDFTWEFAERSVYMPLVNSPIVYGKFAELAASLYSQNAAANVRQFPAFSEASQVMIAEDMGCFLKEVPGLYFFLGVLPEARAELPMRLHTPNLAPDERAISSGLALYIGIIENHRKLL